ncbi:MAG: hypothetical protein ACQEUM_07140 [Pseudomonadota bacterium]
MQYTVTVNQAKAMEWGLNSQQAMLFAFLYEVPSWANPVTREAEVFYALSKAKVIEELPLLTDKPDTVYRMLRVLRDKGLIDLDSTNEITLVRLTDKAKGWNKKQDGSEKYPGQVGKKSEPGRKKIRRGSEKSPTNQDTSNQGTNQDTSNQEPALPDWLSADQWAEFVKHRKQLKAPMSGLAQTKAIAKLGKLRDEGSDPAAVLEQSIVNGWKGVFPVKTNVHRLDDHRPRPKHTGLDQASSAGLTPRPDGTFSL